MRAGRILPADWAGESGFIEGRDGRLWYVICLQAICARADDPLGRQVGDPYLELAADFAQVLGEAFPLGPIGEE